MSSHEKKKPLSQLTGVAYSKAGSYEPANWGCLGQHISPEMLVEFLLPQGLSKPCLQVLCHGFQEYKTPRAYLCRSLANLRILAIYTLLNSSVCAYRRLMACIHLIISAYIYMGFPCGSAGKESTCSVGDLGLIPGLGRSPGEGKVYSLQDSGLENSMDCIVYKAEKSQAQLSNLHSFIHVFTLLNQDFWSGWNLLSFALLGIPGGSGSNESSCNAGDPSLVPGSGRSTGGGNGNPL